MSVEDVPELEVSVAIIITLILFSDMENAAGTDSSPLWRVVSGPYSRNGRIGLLAA